MKFLIRRLVWCGALVALCAATFVIGLAVGQHQCSQQNAIFGLWISKDIQEIQGDTEKTDLFLRATARMYFEILNDPISYRSFLFPHKSAKIERSPKDIDKLTEQFTSLLQPPFGNYTIKDVSKFIRARLTQKPATTFVSLKDQQESVLHP